MTHDPAVQATQPGTRRVVYQAVCDCGWAGHEFIYLTQALDESYAHKAAVTIA